jgi:hypothetical protein
MAGRRDPEKHKDQVRRANKARYKATQALIARHRAEYDTLYEAEAVIAGVDPAGPRPRSVGETKAVTVPSTPATPEVPGTPTIAPVDPFATTPLEAAPVAAAPESEDDVLARVVGVVEDAIAEVEAEDEVAAIQAAAAARLAELEAELEAGVDEGI